VSPPICDHCEKNPAVCVGMYLEMKEWKLACNECCGHGCEDGQCWYLARRQPPGSSDSEIDDYPLGGN